MCVCYLCLCVDVRTFIQINEQKDVSTQSTNSMSPLLIKCAEVKVRAGVYHGVVACLCARMRVDMHS